MEIAMNILAFGLVLSILGIIGGVILIVMSVRSLIADGRSAYKRLQTPIDAAKQIVAAARGAVLINVAHVSSIVADGRAAAQAVSKASREITIAGAELGIAAGAANEEVGGFVGGKGGVEALNFAKDAITLALQMRGL